MGRRIKKLTDNLCPVCDLDILKEITLDEQVGHAAGHLRRGVRHLGAMADSMDSLTECFKAEIGRKVSHHIAQLNNDLGKATEQHAMAERHLNALTDNTEWGSNAAYQQGEKASHDAGASLNQVKGHLDELNHTLAEGDGAQAAHHLGKLREHHQAAADSMSEAADHLDAALGARHTSDEPTRKGAQAKALNFYFAIAKVDAEQQMVWGYATTEALDSQNERVSKLAIERALPDYLKWANVREMHQPSAVGSVVEHSVDGKGLWIGARIVDPTAWLKCTTPAESPVYKGFSIGGKELKREGNLITELILAEISLVDRPANPEAKIAVWKAEGLSHDCRDGEDCECIVALRKGITVEEYWKREFSDKERSALADTGAALPDGSFPIKTEQDLKNAIHAYGRASNKPRAKAHIMSRARALGLSHLIPEEWGGKKFLDIMQTAEAAVVKQLEDEMEREEFEKRFGKETTEAMKGMHAGLSAMGDHMKTMGKSYGTMHKAHEAMMGAHSDVMKCFGKLGFDMASGGGGPEDNAPGTDGGEGVKAPSTSARAAAGPKGDLDGDMQKSLDAGFEKLFTKLDALDARLKKVEAQPTDPKGPTNNVTITKGQDGDAAAIASYAPQGGGATINWADPEAVKALGKAHGILVTPGTPDYAGQIMRLTHLTGARSVSLNGNIARS